MEGLDLKQLNVLREQYLEDRKTRAAACFSAGLLDIDRKIHEMSGKCLEQLRRSFITSGSFENALACHSVIAAPFMEKSVLDMVQKLHPKVKIVQGATKYESSLFLDKAKANEKSDCQEFFGGLKIDITDHVSPALDMSELRKSRQEMERKTELEREQRRRFEEEIHITEVDIAIAAAAPKCRKDLERNYIEEGRFSNYTYSCIGSVKRYDVEPKDLIPLRLKHKNVFFEPTHTCYGDGDCFEDLDNSISFTIKPEYFGVVKD
jgi:hypothetical protein